MPGKVHDRTQSIVRRRRRPAGVGEARAQLRRQRIRRQVAQTQCQLLFGEKAGQRGQCLRLRATPHDQIEIVGACCARAEQFQARKPVERSGDQTQGSDGDQVLVRADEDQAQGAGSTEVRPPGVEPLPGEERVVARAVLKKAAPLGSQRREAKRILDALDGDVRAAALYAGTSAEYIEEVLPAEEVVARLVAEVDRVGAR